MDEQSFAAYTILVKNSLVWKIFIFIFICLGLFWAIFSAIEASSLFTWWIWLIISGVFAIAIEVWKMIQFTGMCLDGTRRENWWRIFRAKRRYYYLIPNFFPNSLVLVGTWFLGIAIIPDGLLFTSLAANYPMIWAIRFIDYFFWGGSMILWSCHMASYMKMDTEYFDKKCGIKNFIVILVIAGFCGATIPFGFLLGVYVGGWVGMIEYQDKKSIAAFAVITAVLLLALVIWIGIHCYKRYKKRKENDQQVKKVPETSQSFDSSRNVIKVEINQKAKPNDDKGKQDLEGAQIQNLGAEGAEKDDKKYEAQNTK